MLETDILRAELERLFELDELLKFSKDLLGFDPESVGQTFAKASFAGALAVHCAENDAIEALCDALLSIRPESSNSIERLRACGTNREEPLPTGSAFAGFDDLREFQSGHLAISYLGRRGATEYRIKILRRETTRDRRGLQRFLILNRLIAGVAHPGLPQKLEVGESDGRTYVAHEHVPGLSLAERLAQSGPVTFGDIRDTLYKILDVLAALHERHIVHGNLRLENVLLAQSPERVVLLDAGSDRLQARPRAQNGGSELFAGASPKTASPEQLRGLSASTRSDLYAFGAMLYELLTGQPPFDTSSPLRAALGHLSETPVAPSRLAPRGVISDELDELLLRLLAKEPNQRPENASALLVLLDQFAASPPKAGELSAERLEALLKRLKEDPTNEETALALESETKGGEHAGTAGEALLEAARAAEPVTPEDDPSAEPTRPAEWRQSMMFRAARLFSSHSETRERAEAVYVELIDLAPEDAVARTSLLDLRRRLRKFEEVIEMLIAESERAESAREKARSFAEIGRIYSQELADQDQALVAFTQAFSEDPEESAYAHPIERIAGSRTEAWNEVLNVAMSAAQDPERSRESKVVLLGRVGRWWAERAHRPDLAASCFQEVLNYEPGNEAALEGLSQIYRRAQQWPELGMVLTRRADAAPTPGRARDWRAEAAEVLEVHLNDAAGARSLYERVVAEDPGHSKAAPALAKLYERLEDYGALVELLEKNIEAQRGEEYVQACCRLADVFEMKLNEPLEAIRRFKTALERDSSSVEALRGLDRLYSKLGRYGELLPNLESQIELATTPRQRITLLERAAVIHDQQFLDHAKAADCWRRLLGIDPEHAGAPSALARHLKALERWEELSELYDRQLETLRDPTQRIQVLLDSARILQGPVGSPERASRAYETVLTIEPEHPEALEALAKLQESAGDRERALGAIESLAQTAKTPEARAEQWVRAARLLESSGDKDGAIERYKRALDANPRDSLAQSGLLEAYTARGDVAGAIQLLEQELEQTEGNLAKGALFGRISLHCKEDLRDDKRAEENAKRALSLDSTNLTARRMLGDVAFDDKRFLEACKHYEALAERGEALEPPLLGRILVRYAEALSHAGSSEKAVQPMEKLLRLNPDDASSFHAAAGVIFEHGSPERAAELYRELASRFSAELVSLERARVLYRLGESLRRGGRLEEAVPPLEEAADLDPSLTDPLIALAKAHEASENWAGAIKAKMRHLDIASGDERVQLLLDVSEISGSRLNDRTQATKSLVAALDERPDDRKLLTRLMQLYSEEKDWNKLVDVVLRLADFVDDPKQRVKYLHTAAIVTARQIGDSERALSFYDQVLQIEPRFDKAISESIELWRKRGDHAAVERLLKQRLELATSDSDAGAMIAAFDELGELYEKGFGWTEQAIDAYEAAHTLDPSNSQRSQLLRKLYGTDPERYLDKAVQSELEILRESPYHAESYRTMRRLYTESKRADEAWCLCQALTVLKLAEPDEERFFKRMRSDTAAPAQSALDDEAWLAYLMHPDADPLLTSVFALIEPAVIARRSTSIIELGYDEAWRVNVDEHPAPVCQSLYYAGGVLGIALPPCYENPNDPGGASFLFAEEPSFVLGVTALRSDVPLRLAAFIAANKLAYLRPGMYVRHLLASGTALKAWFFGAIKLTSPAFPIAPELEGAVNEALSALDASLQGQARDHLTRVVAKLLTSGAALDLKRWILAIDLTADRAGFLIAHDLATALHVVRASEEGTSAVPTEDRAKELVLYSVSPEYLALRRKLGITIDS